MLQTVHCIYLKLVADKNLSFPAEQKSLDYVLINKIDRLHICPRRQIFACCNNRFYNLIRSQPWRKADRFGISLPQKRRPGIPAMSAGNEGDGGKTAKGKSRKAAAMNSASNAKVKQGGQGRVKDPSRDRRLAANRTGPTGQGRVKDSGRDKRLAQNRPGPTGQGRVKNPDQDRRLSVNREGPTGQGRVKDPKHDRRLSENRPGPTGQGRVKNPTRDKRLRDNRTT